MGSSSKLLEHRERERERREAIVIVVVGAELGDYGLISERGGVDLDLDWTA